MAEPAPTPDLGLTEADIEALAADGAFEIDTDSDPNASLVRLTRTIASHYVDRFQDWADSQDEVATDVALRALADVDRLAASTGDAALQSAIASLPRQREPSRRTGFLRTWIDRIGGLLGSADRERTDL